MSPVKGRRNGFANREQRRNGPSGRNEAIGRETDGIKTGCGSELAEVVEVDIKRDKWMIE
jgi:hypothetical protein